MGDSRPEQVTPPPPLPHPTVLEGGGGRAQRGSSLSLQDVAQRSCLQEDPAGMETCNVTPATRGATGFWRRRKGGIAEGSPGGLKQLAFRRLRRGEAGPVLRRGACWCRYVSSLTSSRSQGSPGPNRRQLVALPLQKFLWTRGATEELPPGAGKAVPHTKIRGKGGEGVWVCGGA